MGTLTGKWSEMESEEKILDALRSGNKRDRDQAENSIYESFQPRVRAILSRVVGTGADLDDAVQEAFIDVFRGLPKFQGRSGIGTWIYRIALRRGWKWSARQQATRKQQVENPGPIENTSDPDAASDIHTREMARRFEAAIQELDYKHRSVIALSGLEGLTPNEIAKTLGIPVGTVHSRLSRARATLKSILNVD